MLLKFVVALLYLKCIRVSRQFKLEDVVNGLTWFIKRIQSEMSFPKQIFAHPKPCKYVYYLLIESELRQTVSNFKFVLKTLSNEYYKGSEVQRFFFLGLFTIRAISKGLK